MNIWKKVCLYAIAALLCAGVISLIFLYRERPIITTPYTFDPASNTRGERNQVHLISVSLSGRDYSHIIDAEELVLLISQATMRRQPPIFTIGNTGQWSIRLYQEGNRHGAMHLMIGERNVIALEHGWRSRALPVIVGGRDIYDGLMDMIMEYYQGIR